MRASLSFRSWVEENRENVEPRTEKKIRVDQGPNPKFRFQSFIVAPPPASKCLEGSTNSEWSISYVQIEHLETMRN